MHLVLRVQCFNPQCDGVSARLYVAIFRYQDPPAAMTLLPKIKGTAKTRNVRLRLFRGWYPGSSTFEGCQVRLLVGSSFIKKIDIEALFKERAS
jgi:hypothetical protein